MELTARRVEVEPGVGLASHVLDGAGAADRLSFLCIHGLASNAKLWDQVAFHLATAGHDVAAVDLRGHGRSDKPEYGYDTPQVAADVAAVIDTLGHDHPVVVGQSWGANVVVQLAADHAERISGVACVDGGTIDLQSRFATFEECARILAPPRLVGTPGAEIRGWLRQAHPDWPEAGIEATMANFEVRADGTIAPWLTYEHHMLVLRGLYDHRPSELFGGLRSPVLLIPATSADGDTEVRRPVSIADVEAAAAAIPEAQIHPMVGDHDLHAQHPAQLAELLHRHTTNGFFRPPAPTAA